MCGIAGLLSIEPAQQAPSLVKAMTDAIAHRGPDGEGIHVDAEGRVVLGHRRLAIVDLAPTGRQPMVSGAGRYVVTYNGEIYNFPELRRELEQRGCAFRGTSDTEVMLAAFDTWGVSAALARLNGMFAFAVWDRTERRLWLARDRAGEKPLYYWSDGRQLIFASEMKALMCCPAVPCTVDRDALCSFLRFSYLPAPATIFQRVRKLEAAAVLSARLTGDSLDIVSERYWTAPQLFRDARAAQRQDIAWQERIETAETLLGDAVRMRMVADVPLGAFLSGGIDSSAIVALMQRNSATPVRTFTVGFDEFGFNEAPYAAAVARHLGTDHTEVQLSAADALACVPSLADIYDEPFGDSSQIPTLLISRVARRSVTVALSGDGGDEVFGGYHRYVWWRRFWRLSRALPQVALGLLTSLMRSTGNVYGSGRPFARTLLRGRLAEWGDVAEKMQKTADILRQKSFRGIFMRLISQTMSPEEMVSGGREPESLISSWCYPQDESAFTEEMMLLDFLSYLPDDILVKVDRASMACSLETRAPFLDHRLVQWSWGLPLEAKIQNTTGKRILREIAYRHVPRELLERPKQGFGIPITQWLRGPLRDWGHDLLDPARMRSQQILNVERVSAAWHDLQSGRRLQPHFMWNILMLQAWLERWKHRISY